MKFDVIIIGGSYAGLSAALQLGRARKSILIIDAGEPRNRFASHSHGFLGQDGRALGRSLPRRDTSSNVTKPYNGPRGG